MPFPTQGDRNDCGAYCLAYFCELVAGRGPDNHQLLPGNIDRIYNQIQFGRGYPSIMGLNISDYSNPIKMIMYLINGGYFCSLTFYNGGDQFITAIANNLIIELPIRYIFAELPPLQHNDYAIEICSVNMGLHYILRKGSLDMYNPWRGTRETYPSGLGVPGTLNALTSTWSGIYLSQTRHPSWGRRGRRSSF